MEADNLQEAEKLRLLIEHGEKGLNKLQEALVDIAQSQLEARKIEVFLICLSGFYRYRLVFLIYHIFFNIIYF